MKKLLVLILFIFAMNINAQVSIKANKAVLQNDTSFPKDQPVDIRLLHPDFEKGTEQYLQAHPEGLLKNRMSKTSFNYVVGSTHSFKSADLSTSAPYTFFSVPSTCQAVGTNCYIFVENASWDAGRVTITEVNAVQNAFDNSTPANAAKGIYQTNVDTFGNPPNVDGDSKIIILILDIKDGYTPGNAYTVGYFYSLDQTTDPNSNQAEIYYLDCNPLNLKTSGGLQTGMATAAHEFQHMIHWNYHHTPSGSSKQTTFFNEGCSLIAERVNGYPFREQTRFANDAAQGLLVWRTGNDVLKDYSRAARFALYFYEQFGTQYLTKFVQSAYEGITGIDDALSNLSVSTSRRFADILPDWYIANAVDDKTVNPKWGYTLTGMPKPQGNLYWNSNVNIYSSNVPYLGAQIITHKGSYSLNSTFGAGNSTYLKVKAIKFGTGSTVVEDVNLNSTYSVPVLSGTYSSVQYLIMNSNITTDYSVPYSSTGTSPSAYEVSYSINPTVGSFGWNIGDTVCVNFDGVSFGKLDSLKIQIANTGTLTGGIWEYTGVSNPTPLGTKLLSNMSVTSTTTRQWAKIDLTANNISTTKPFAVAFPVVAKATGVPAVMVSEYPAATAYHSYTYLVAADASPSPAGWFYVNKNDSVIYIYMIKAYVSVGTVGNEKVVEVLPFNYSLSQNYPNPFNPTTKIKFSLPEASKVTIRIYDMLGREVKTLVNAQHSAGTHEVEWRGDDNSGQKVATGIYLYALSTNKLLLTKKMILLK